MNVRPLFLRRLAGLTVLTATLLCGQGCETTKTETEDIAATRPLSFPAPRSMTAAAGTGKWTAIPRDGGAEYVQVLGDMEDVVSFYGFSHPVDPKVRTFEDMEAVMRTDNTFGFRSLERGEIRGVPVLWFEKVATEKGAGSEAQAKALGANPRAADGTYLVSTRGVFLLQPGAQPRFVTIACARTSTHGHIGPVYQTQFQGWLTTIVENCFL